MSVVANINDRKRSVNGFKVDVAELVGNTERKMKQDYNPKIKSN